MDIFFRDPNEIPLPPADVRIRQLTAAPWPDGRRVRVTLEVEPFQKRPSAQIEIFDEQGQVVAQVSVIESMTRKMEFNMHLRQAQPGKYSLRVELYYEQAPVQPAAEPPAEAAAENSPAPETPRLTVDRGETNFEIAT